VAARAARAIWRRANGQSGVPVADIQRHIKKRAAKLKKKTGLYQRFMASAASAHMTFQQWLSKSPSVRRKLINEERDTPDALQSDEGPPWE
jgi:hypothetical protein